MYEPISTYSYPANTAGASSGAGIVGIIVLVVAFFSRHRVPVAIAAYSGRAVMITGLRVSGSNHAHDDLTMITFFYCRWIAITITAYRARAIKVAAR